MKAICLWQPWASLWISGCKVHETRSWATSYRGPLLVHASKKFVKDITGPLREILDDEFGGHWAIDLPTGAILGCINLVDCQPVDSLGDWHFKTDDYHCGDFSAGRFAWKGELPHRYERPIPHVGRQRIFNAPSEIALAQPAPKAPESRSRTDTDGGTGEELSNSVADQFKNYAKDVLARHAAPQSPPQRFGDGTKEGTGE